MVKFEIYSSRNCSFCRQAKRLLEKRGISFTDIPVDGAGHDRLQEMLNRSNGHRSVPQIFAGTIHIGGYEELAKWGRDGRLDGLASTSTK